MQRRWGIDLAQVSVIALSHGHNDHTRGLQYWSGGYVDSNDVCHVGKLVVHPGYQNQGIGKALMYEIEKYFPACRKLVVFTGEETPNTLHLYEKSRLPYRFERKDGRSFYDFDGKGYNSLIFYCQIMFLKIFL